MTSVRAGKMKAVDESASDFVEFTASMRLPLAPIWSSKPSLSLGESSSSTGLRRDAQGSAGVLDAVTEILDGWTMRYLPPLNGVLLSFDAHHVKLLHPRIAFHPKHDPLSSDPYPAWDEDDQEGDGINNMVSGTSLPMVDGSGFMLVNVGWRGIAWRPLIGQSMHGTMTLSTPSHVSLIVHNLFNASVPANHLPDEFEFDPDYPVPEPVQQRRSFMPAGLASRVVADQQKSPSPPSPSLQQTEDADGEGDAEDDNEKDEDEEKEQLQELERQEREEEEMYAERGWWVHKQTREPLGGPHARVTFTVIGLTVASSMISCTGSLLADPFSRPTKESAIAKVAKKTNVDQRTEETERVVAGGDLDSGDDESDDSDRVASDVGQDDDHEEEQRSPPKIQKESKKDKKDKKERKRAAERDGDRDSGPKKQKKKAKKADN